MKMRHLAWLLFLLPVACARLPVIHEPAGDHSAETKACGRIFPEGRWQLLHSIEAVAPDGSRHTMLGIIQLSSHDRTLHCAMMTLEGLILFEARYDGAVHVRRAVPPMDRPGLGEGMMRDLKLIFFAPGALPLRSGDLADGERICRYPLPDGGTQDISLTSGGDWTIRRYNTRQRLTRTVRTDPAAPRSSLGFPTRLVLQAHGWIGYRLTMTLIEAQPLGDTP